ncbi:hypothetical protein [Actinobacillus pleuropneumoniae]|nr:hypothetical protein [Actinobacillus pleuropneumoniae]UKH19989.1 hypothetical protein D1109_01960 [Actinobacillus pleuropneumoniae]UPA21802.1 hypothetical protein JS559_04930 [Actinobacillus pleuropneumoniae]
MEQLKQLFSEQKAKFLAQETIVEKAEAEELKNNNLLEAFQNELNELALRTKSKISQGETLTADEYVELKNADSGLKARIEYHKSAAVDLSNNTYQAKSKLLELKNQANLTRQKIVKSEAEKLINEVIEKNKDVLSKIFTLLSFSGDFEETELDRMTDETKSKKILAYMQKSIINAIDENQRIDVELSLYSAKLTGFKEKSPMVIHRESFEQPQGIKALINQLIEGE